MSEDGQGEAWGFSPPPFRADEAMQGLRRQLRDLGLSERPGGQGLWDRRGTPIAKIALNGNTIHAARVQRPSRNSPQWSTRNLATSAGVRDFVADLKKQLAQWSDHDD